IRDFHVTGVQTCALPIFGALVERGVHAEDVAAVEDAVRAAEDALNIATYEWEEAKAHRDLELERARNGVVLKAEPDVTITDPGTGRIDTEQDLALWRLAKRMLESSRNGAEPRLQVHVVGDLNQNAAEELRRSVVARFEQ